MPYIQNSNSSYTTTAKSSRNSFDDYSQLPPPPYTSSSSSIINKGNDEKDSAYHDQQQNETTLPVFSNKLQYVKDYFIKLKELSPLQHFSHESNENKKSLIATATTTSSTDHFTDNNTTTLITINNFIIQPPSSPITETSDTISMTNNNNNGDVYINEGLERIGVSLQQLIDEAQASLLVQQNTTSSSYEYIATTTESIANSSLQYIQNRYLKSQEKISIALEQLDQSIQTFSSPNTTTTKHHYYEPRIKRPSFSPKPFKTKLLGLFLTLLLSSLSLYSDRNNNNNNRTLSTLKSNMISLSILAISFYYRKKNPRKTNMVQTLDTCLVRLLHSTRITKWIYRFNMCFTIINSFLLLL